MHPSASSPLPLARPPNPDSLSRRGTLRLVLCCLLVALACWSCTGAAPSRTAGESGSAVLPALRPPRTAFVLYGDSRSDPGVHARVLSAIGKADPLAVFHTGDMTADGSDPEEWEHFAQATAALRARTEFYSAIGNHESSFSLYAEYLSPPGNGRWYSVRKGDVFFIVLDTNSPLGQGSAQLAWLEGELAAARDATPFTVVLGHHAPFTTGARHRDDEKGQRKTVVPLLERYGVQLYAAGHTHHYERSQHNGIFYLVTGGGGAPLYWQERRSPYSQRFVKAYHFCRLWVADGRLHLEAQDLEGPVIDRFALEPRQGNRFSPLRPLDGAAATGYKGDSLGHLLPFSGRVPSFGGTR